MHSSAKKLQVLSSREIRKNFIDFFVNNHEHKFVRSSPVVPWSDPTVSFVNAGMNQVGFPVSEENCIIGLFGNHLPLCMSNG